MKLIIFKRFHCRKVCRSLRGILILSVVAIMPAVMAGCIAVGPDYARVEPQVSQKWHSELSGGLAAGPTEPEIMASWWTILNDPELSSLEGRAVKDNLGLKEAKARIREARARRGISSANFFPVLDAGASAVKYRSSENSGTGHEEELYAAGFDAGWELDIFGGVRRSVEAAEADIHAAQEDLRGVMVSLMAEVAINYVEVRTFQTRLAATEGNLKVQEETWSLNNSRFQAGIISELPVQQSLYNVERTRSLIPTLQIGLEGAKNRLSVLLGKRPGSVHEELACRRPIPVPPVTVAVGVPAETLRNRPDIRRAERMLAAQTARIGVATADLYPKFHLIGSIGLESISTGSLLEMDSRTWNIGPGFSWNIFDAGAIRQNIKVQSALQKQALLQYEEVVLEAHEEVENVLVAYAKEQYRQKSLAAATAAAQRAYELAHDQYKAGLVDFTNVLDAQRSLQTFQDELAQSKGTVTSNLVRLYKALGGGWATRNAKGSPKNHFTF